MTTISTIAALSLKVTPMDIDHSTYLTHVSVVSQVSSNRRKLEYSESLGDPCDLEGNPLPADYPEQVMLAGIVQNWCAK
jgi:hypothetical protein